MLAVLRGERPGKPLDAESLGFSDALWELVQLCWSESSSTRPTAQRLLDHLSIASPTWVPPPVYPIVAIDTPSTTNSDSSFNSVPGEFDMRGVGGGNSILLAVVLFLFYLIG